MEVCHEMGMCSGGKNAFPQQIITASLGSTEDNQSYPLEEKRASIWDGTALEIRRRNVVSQDLNAVGYSSVKERSSFGPLKQSCVQVFSGGLSHGPVDIPFAALPQWERGCV
jgi:hypothetical protein